MSTVILPQNFPTKYQSVLTSLTVLKRIESLQAGNKPQNNNNERKTQVDARGNKKTKAQTQEKPFKFTKEMFMNNSQSTDAFIRVTHFLFSMLDKTDTETRFREAWPIYDKKQESLYRRKALEWFKLIISENPTFFMKGVEVQLQGLIVNPYGDRFIRFLHSFVNFVMLTISAREETVPDNENFKEPILYKPKFTANPEVTKRQAKSLTARTERLENMSLDWMRTLYRNQVAFKETKAEIVKQETLVEKRLNQRISVLIKLIPLKSFYFPENAIELLNSHEEYFTRELQKYPITDLTAIDRIPAHPLNTHVDMVWKEQLQQLGGKVDSITSYFQRHSRLWTLLNLMSIQKPIELDVSKLYFPSDYQSGRKAVSVHTFFEWTATVVQEFHQKLQNTTISKDLLEKVEGLNSKVKQIKESASSIEDIQCPDVKQMKKQVEFEMKTLYFKLENVDWSKYSHVHDPPLSTMFSFSPTRVVDASKETGLTPALSTYLKDIHSRRLITDDLLQ